MALPIASSSKVATTSSISAPPKEGGPRLAKAHHANPQRHLSFRPPFNHRRSGRRLLTARSVQAFCGQAIQCLIVSKVNSIYAVRRSSLM
jgi:hypothetical protein